MSSNQQQQQGVILRRISSNTTSSSCARFAEVAGGTAADCAVICCCFPVGILNLAILALYTLPAAICKKLFNKKRRQQNQKQRLQQHKLLRKGEAAVVVRRSSTACVCGCEADRQVHPVTTSFKDLEEVKRLEKEMWDTFYNTGFWRSPSQRHNS